MEVLKSIRGPIDTVGISLLPLVFAFFIMQAVPFIKEPYNWYILAIIFAACILFGFTFGRRPAAWIKDDKLFIRFGIFSTNVIKKKSIEYIKYETGHSMQELTGKGSYAELHLLKVKMKGFNEWPIKVTDKTEHMHNLRLFKYIRDKFYNKIEFIKR